MTSDIQYEYHDPAKARTLVNSSRRRLFFVRTAVDLATTFKEDGEPDRGYSDYSGLAQVTQAIALKWLADLERFADMCEKADKPRPKLKIGTADNCMFLG